jgi:two-component system response regulator AtoC
VRYWLCRLVFQFNFSLMLAKASTELANEAAPILGLGPVMEAINSMVRNIAATDIPILLLGESGTGKEVYAGLIHSFSPASERPPVKFNCASLTPETLREEVTSAAASHGVGSPQITLFLDDVHDLDFDCQRALLSFLSAEAPRNGRSSPLARLISTTSRDLEQEIEAGRFRRELYFRINGACLRLPALRERRQDIPALLDHFLAKHSNQLGKPAPVVSSADMETLFSHAWPGNIRELENTARKIVALGRAHLALADLRPATRNTSTPEPVKISSLKIAARAASRQTERELILKALERTRWNRKRAAQELQISYKSLLYKLKQIGIPD